MLTLNQQSAEPLDYQEDGSLDVIDIWQTIQGEGPLVGHPAVFVRLAGCNFDCSGCDTDYTTGRHRMDAKDLGAAIAKAQSPGTQLVVLTGGEPFRQNIAPLIECLQLLQIVVQIETNGTIGPREKDLRIFAPDSRSKAQPPYIVCSPKAPTVHKRLLPLIHSYKYILRAGSVDPTDGLPTIILNNKIKPARPQNGFDMREIYVQPQDEQDPILNEANTRAALDSCYRHGYRLSVQTHKWLGLK